MKIFELWYEFLRRTSYNKWSDRVKASFEKFDDPPIPFNEWWELHKELFLPYMERFYLKEIDNVEEYQYWHERDALQLVVMVNLENPKSGIVKAFEELLSTKMSVKAGRPNPNDQQDRWCEFPLNGKVDAPTIKVLETILKVYDLYKGEDLTLNEIGLKLKLNPSSQSEEPARAMTATVARYLRWSEQLKENVANGVFPMYD